MRMPTANVLFLHVALTTIINPINAQNLNARISDDAAAAILGDVRIHSSTGYTSALGISLACCSGTLSAISSIVLMYLIFKSKNRLGSVYHRFMMGFSCIHLTWSIAVAFSTLPMPTESIYTGFQGIIAGNIYTCEAQGFVVTFCSIASSIYLVFLAIYYLCSIRYNMSDNLFQTRIEHRFMYPILIGCPLSIATFMVFCNSLNPTPYYVTCTSTPYPYWCTESECNIRGTTKLNERILIVAVAAIFILTILSAIIIFAIIIWSVYRQERAINLLTIGGTIHEQSARHQGMRNTKASFIHVMSYFMAYGLTSIFWIYRFFVNVENIPYGMQIAQCFISPLRGFFNLLIFIGLKVYNLKRHDGKLSARECLMKTFRGHEVEIVVLSQLSIVRDYTSSTASPVSIQEEQGEEKGHDDDVLSHMEESFVDNDISFPSNEHSNSDHLSYAVSSTNIKSKDDSNSDTSPTVADGTNGKYFQAIQYNALRRTGGNTGESNSTKGFA